MAREKNQIDGTDSAEMKVGNTALTKEADGMKRDRNMESER